MSQHSADDPRASSGPATERAEEKTTPCADGKQACSAESFSMDCTQAPVGMFCADLDGSVSFMNPWLARHLGYDDPKPALDAVNSNISAFYQDQDALARLTATLADHDMVADFEMPVCRADGVTIWLSLHCTLVEDDDGYHIEGFATDIGPRKKSQAALRRNEERYRAIVQDQTEFICRYDPDGTLTFVNDAYARYFGKSREELHGSRFSPPIPDDDRDEVAERVGSLSPRSPVVSMEHRVLMPFGGTRWNLWILRAIHDDAGKVIEYQAVGRDITSQKTTEQALRKSEERFRLLAENMGELVCLMDSSEARLQYVSPSCYRLLGYAPQEMAGQLLYDFVHPDDLVELRATLARLIQGLSAPLATTVRMRRQGGEHLWLEICATAVREGMGEVTGLVASARDITERRAAENACSQAEEQFRSLFENSTQGIYRTTPEGTMVMANEALAKTFGFSSAQEMIDSYHNISLQLYVDPARRHELQRALARDGKIVHSESQVYKKDGSIFWISETASQVCDASGKPIYYDGTMIDITERKRFERELGALNQHLEALVEDRTRGLKQKTEELEEANRRLKELDEMKSALLSSVSHELRTPLTSIRGFAKLVDRDFVRRFMPIAKQEQGLEKKADDIRSNLHIIEEQSGRLSDLINSFLELSAIESGTMEWDDALISMPEAVGQAVEAARLLFLRRPQLRLDVDVEERLPAIRGDAKRIVQLLVNLLDNAVKFTTEGDVVLRARRSMGTADPAKSAVRLEVRDTGRGIDEQELTTIFDSFQQGTQDVLNDKPAGTGLGLAICRRIVEHHQGRIWAESTPGQGTTFIVELPAADAA